MQHEDLEEACPNHSQESPGDCLEVEVVALEAGRPVHVCLQNALHPNSSRGSGRDTGKPADRCPPRALAP